MQLLAESQTSFARGMNDSAAPDEYAPDECELMINVRPSLEGGAARRRMGSKRTHPTALNAGAQGYGGKEYRTAAGAHRLVVAFGDKFYRSTDFGATWTQIATGLTQAYWDLAIMRVGTDNLLLAANGSASIYKWDGTTWGTLAGAPSGVTRLAVNNDRLYVAGHSGVTIQASAVGNPEEWTSPGGALTINYATHDGDPEVVRIFSHSGLTLVWKRESFGYIEGFGVQTIQVQAGTRGFSRSVGMRAWRSLQAIGDRGLAWLSDRGFEYYEVGGAPTVISDSVRKFMDAIDWEQIATTPGVPDSIWVPRVREYRCAVPVASTQNRKEFVFRPPTPRAPAATWINEFRAPGGSGVEVNAITGYLELVPGGQLIEVDATSGYLELSPTSGVQAAVDGSTGYLGLANPAHVPAALFLSDLDEDPAQPMALGYDGFVRQLDTGNDEDEVSDGTSSAGAVQGRLKTRPMLFGDTFARKKPKRLYVSAKPEGGASSAVIDAGVIVDGVTAGRRELTFVETGGQKPTREKGRFGGARGYALQGDLVFEADVTVQAVQLLAEPLGGTL